MNELNSIDLASTSRLPFRVRLVVENTVATGTDAASLPSIGNRLECCCQKCQNWRISYPCSL